MVPPHLRGEPHLVLQYGHDLPIPIPDLEIDEHGVRATLSFSKSPQRTVVPWSAVYVVACDDGRGVLYHEDVPEDVSIVAARSHADRAGSGEQNDGLDGADEGSATGDAPGSNGPSGRISQRLLRSVPADGSAPAPAELAQPVSSRRRRKPLLRLVK